MSPTLHVPVLEQSQAGEARRLAVSYALQHGCGEHDTGQLALVVSELAKNLVLHTSQGGEILVRVLQRTPFAVEILSVDRGPGMANFATCLRDGYSTSGTAGTGLGAVQRASTIFDAHSSVGVGTVILSRLYSKPEGVERECGLASINVAKAGQTECGDTFALRTLSGGRMLLMMADGLGHGPEAAAASAEARKVFCLHAKGLQPLLEHMNDALRATRGAAIAIAEVDPSSRRLTYAGVGNIATSVLAEGKTQHLVSMNGTVGATFPRVKVFDYEWPPDAMLVMHTDGIKTQWQLDAQSGLLNKHPALSAGVLFRDFNRRTDDTTVATLRLPYEHRV